MSCPRSTASTESAAIFLRTSGCRRVAACLGLGDFRLLQHYLPQTEVKRQAITSTTLNDIVQSLLDEVSDYRHCTFRCIGDCRRQENRSN